MKHFNWNDETSLRKLIKNSRSRTEVLQKIGYNVTASVSRRKLNNAIGKFQINTEHFVLNSDRWNKLPNIIKECYSVGDVLKAVGLQDQGDNFKTARRYIAKFNLDVTHFHQYAGSSISPYAKEDVFCENSTVTRHTVRNWVLREPLLPYVCNRCKITHWDGEELTLDLDHINGINNDNRLENLRFLCPNCHSLTPTHRGKNKNHGV